MSDWYDPAATKAEVLALLRLSSTDVDVDLIESTIPAAAFAIERFVDPITTPIPGPPPDPALQTELDAVTVRMYHRAAAVATVGGGAVFESASGSEPFDPLADSYAALYPFKQGWPVA